MLFKIFNAVLIVLTISMFTSMKLEGAESELGTIITKFPTSFQNKNGSPVIYGSYKKYSNRAYILTAAQLVSGNDLAPIQILSKGTNRISILIGNNTQFIRAETEINAVNGEEYFLNFEYEDPNQEQYKYMQAPFVVERIWITSSKGAIIKEIVSWSDARQISEIYKPSLS